MLPRTDSLRMITLDRLTVTVLRHHQGHHHRGPHFPPLASYSRVQLGRDGPGIIQRTPSDAGLRYGILSSSPSPPTEVFGHVTSAGCQLHDLSGVSLPTPLRPGNNRSRIASADGN